MTAIDAVDGSPPTRQPLGGWQNGGEPWNQR
jgi:hypothetical protein